jgi:hypothetical protein
MLEERREQARGWTVGMRQLLDRLNRDTRAFIDEANRRLLEAANEDECDRIIDDAEIANLQLECDRFLTNYSCAPKLIR